MHTNEVYMRLSSNVTVHTSASHASGILERRKAYIKEQQDLVDQQLGAMTARKRFATEEREQQGVRTI